jgi:DNA-binding SARP family transcriptional activator
MLFRLLGRLEVVADDGRAVALTGDKERIVLAVLVLGANRMVLTDRLIDALWGEHPPQNAGNALQVQVSRLRKKLAAGSYGGGALRSEPSGYRLAVAPGELDVACFEELVRSAEGTPAEVSCRLVEALETIT